MAVGLVDKLGGLEDSIQEAADVSGLSGRKWSLLEVPKKKTMIDMFDFSGGNKPPASAFSPRSSMNTAIEQAMSVLQTLNDPNGVYARLPIGFKID